MAARYWVGGSGTWDNSSTANWAATSGGASGASAPISTDTVTFDTNSGTAATVSVAATATCATCAINKADINLNLTGSPTFTGALTLTTGTITLNSFTLSCTQVNASNSNTRTIAWGTGRIKLTGNSSVWVVATTTDLTFTGTPVIEIANSGAVATTYSMTMPEATSPTLLVTAGTYTLAVGGTVNTLDLTGFAGTLGNNARTIYGNLVISTGTTIGAGSATTTFSATSGIKTITTNGKTLDFTITFDGVGGTFRLLDNLTQGSTRQTTLTNGTLDLNSFTYTCGFFNANNSNTRMIAFGTGSITITGAGTVWNVSTSTNMTTTGTPVVNISNNTATAATVIPGGLSEANAMSFNFPNGTYALTFLSNSNSSAKNVDFTGFAGTLGTTNATATIYGNLTISTGMSLTSSANTLTFGATSGTKTITTNGKTVDFSLTFNGVGGTFSFADALTQGSTRAFTITNGTVKLKNGTTNTVGSFATGAGTTQRFLQSTVAGTQATITDPSGTNAASYLTIQDIAATGGATWNAFAASGSIDAGNNTGWNFGYTPQYAYEYPIEFRSFTKRTRF
jgi:hypothetical protein